MKKAHSLSAQFSNSKQNPPRKWGVVALVIILLLILFFVCRQVLLARGSNVGHNDQLSSEYAPLSSRKKSFDSSGDLISGRSLRSGDQVGIEDMPLEVEDWNISENDRNIFLKLSDELKQREISRIIDESHVYSDTVIPEGEQGGFGVDEDVKSIEVLKVTTALRSPNPLELGEIYKRLNQATSESSLSESEKFKVRLFFEERFSLKIRNFKILTTTAHKQDVSDKISRYTYVLVCDEFISEGEEGEKNITFGLGRSRIEANYTNPEERVSKRYGHLIDTEAGE